MQVVFDKKTGAAPIKLFTDGVPVEESAMHQLANVARLPFVTHVAAMPDVHWGIGATVGSVIAAHKAIIPAAVGVDIGCGMAAVQTTLRADDLPDSLAPMRANIEAAVPHGRTDNGGANDIGGWRGRVPDHVGAEWERTLAKEFEQIADKHPKVRRSNHANHLGSLGTGNHFIEVCLDLEDRVWLMLHSGSRGVGARIGTHFIGLAKDEMRRFFINLPDANLAYLPEGSQYFADYVKALNWAQRYARVNRDIMMAAVAKAVRKAVGRPFEMTETAINCHHNYVAKERHFKQDVWLTRKGAVRAGKGDLGIIPGSMGARSFIVRGKGNKHSMQSCSHGAGRAMGRNEARRRFSKADLAAQTEGVECRKDADVIDEIPAAYKEIDAVMAAQEDLVEVVAELRQVVCVKG